MIWINPSKLALALSVRRLATKGANRARRLSRRSCGRAQAL